MKEDVEEILISEEQIRVKVQELGLQITRDYQGKDLLLLGTLKGAVPFLADLARAIDLPLELDYIAVASYGNSTESSGIVRIVKDLDDPINSKHVRTTPRKVFKICSPAAEALSGEGRPRVGPGDARCV